MSTNSYIGYETEPEKYKFIYCHWDGYLEHNGLILNEAYKDREMVEELVNGGDISSLGVDPSYVKYHEELSQEEKKKLYEDNVHPVIRYKSWNENNFYIVEGKDDLQDFISGNEYTYLYTLDDEWKYSGEENHYKLTSLDGNMKRRTHWYPEARKEIEVIINESNKLTDVSLVEEDYEEDDYDM